MKEIISIEKKPEPEKVSFNFKDVIFTGVTVTYVLFILSIFVFYLLTGTAPNDIAYYIFCIPLVLMGGCEVGDPEKERRSPIAVYFKGGVLLTEIMLMSVPVMAFFGSPYRAWNEMPEEKIPKIYTASDIARITLKDESASSRNHVSFYTYEHEIDLENKTAALYKIRKEDGDVTEEVHKDITDDDIAKLIEVLDEAKITRWEGLYGKYFVTEEGDVPDIYMVWQMNEMEERAGAKVFTVYYSDGNKSQSRIANNADEPPKNYRKAAGRIYALCPQP